MEGTARGSVVSFGWNGYGQLGCGDVEFHETAVTVKGLVGSTVAQLAAGGSHFRGFSLARLNDGSVMAWGDNSDGQLHGTGTHSTEPQRIATAGSARVISIACGSQHSLLVLEDGSVLAAGDNAFHQLPPKVIDGVVIKAASCGDTHSLLLSDQGRVFAFGNPKFVPRPISIATLSVAMVACGQNHSLLLLQDGNVVSFGANTHGQLGVKGLPEVVLEPVSVSLESRRVTAVSAGAQHSLALCESGQCFGWGSNEHNQLVEGNAAPSIVQNPIVLTDAETTIICAGGFHSLLLLRNGSVWTRGCNTERQCAYDDVSSSSKDQVSLLAASETHSLIL